MPRTGNDGAPRVRDGSRPACLRLPMADPLCGLQRSKGRPNDRCMLASARVKGQALKARAPG
jgi:hypothetical protein